MKAMARFKCGHSHVIKVYCASEMPSSAWPRPDLGEVSPENRPKACETAQVEACRDRPCGWCLSGRKPPEGAL